MDPGIRSHGMKADPPGYLWSKYECFVMSGSGDIPHLRNFNAKRGGKFYERDGRTNEHTNGKKKTNDGKCYNTLCKT